MRAFLGGMKNESLMAESDEALVAAVRRELTQILGEQIVPRDARPEHTQVSRWRRAMAQYAVGHQERIAQIEERVAELPGLKLAGNAYDGIGIPDCIRLGRQAAQGSWRGQAQRRSRRWGDWLLTPEALISLSTWLG